MTSRSERAAYLGSLVKTRRGHRALVILLTLPLLVGVAGCAGSETPRADPTSATPADSPSYRAPSEQPTAAVPELPRVEGLPAELEGTWCSAIDDDCFSFSQLKVEYPQMVFVPGDEISMQGPAILEFCFAPDETGTCDMATSGFYMYFLPGVPWNCQDAADALGLPRCVPDYTDLHDISQARLLHIPNHQMNDTYDDVPPYYRQS